VVLHHVTQRAGLVVERATALDAQRLGDRDLHVADAAAPPQRLEQRIAEAQREQVLHCLLAEVMVDAEDLRSSNTKPTCWLIDVALARSWPSGFSSTTRDAGVARPSEPICRHNAANSDGAVDRKNTRGTAYNDMLSAHQPFERYPSR
jgi:hypothetical protein